ncbi:sulfatase-like hydrolase/transferase [Aliamphritea spongicola]
MLDESDQPLFINILTVSNHPPYFTPDSYTPGPVDVSAEYQARAGGGEIELDNILKTFQYAADSLGRFIGDVKASDKLADNTVIAATGDHQMRRFEARLPEESMLDSAVPFTCGYQTVFSTAGSSAMTANGSAPIKTLCRHCTT